MTEGLNGRHRRGTAGRASFALVLLSIHLTACYTYVPVSGASVTPGSTATVSINDRGRVELSDVLGPGARRIDGRVVSATDTGLLMSVTAVQLIDLDVPIRWEGRQISLSSSLFSDIRQKRLSKGRTWLLAATMTAGAILASTFAVRGFGTDPGSDKPGGGGDNSK